MPNIADLVSNNNGGNASLWNAHTALGIQSYSADQLHAWYEAAVGHDGHIADLMHEYWTSPAFSPEFTHNYTAAGTSGTLAIPADFANGDTFLFVASWSSTSVGISVGPSCTNVVTADVGGGFQSNGADLNCTMWAGTAIGTPGANVVFTMDGNTNVKTTVVNLGAVGTPEWLTLQANGSSTSATNAGGTFTAGPPTRYGVVVAHRRAANTTWTEPSGWTLVDQDDHASVEAAIFTTQNPSAGATGNITSTMGGAAKTAVGGIGYYE